MPGDHFHWSRTADRPSGTCFKDAQSSEPPRVQNEMNQNFKQVHLQEETKTPRAARCSLTPNAIPESLRPGNKDCLLESTIITQGQKSLASLITSAGLKGAQGTAATQQQVGISRCQNFW